MVSSARLHEELFSWFVSAGLVVPIVFLIHLLPILSSMSRLPPTENQLDLFFRYGGPIGETIIYGGITIFLALLWHVPRILGANVIHNHLWLDRSIANSIFWVGALVAAISAKIASLSCFAQIEAKIFRPSSIRVFHEHAILCQPDPKLTIFALSIWSILLVFSIAYGTRIAWICWKKK